jgi:glycosyl transferase family 87
MMTTIANPTLWCLLFLIAAGILRGAVSHRDLRNQADRTLCKWPVLAFLLVATVVAVGSRIYLGFIVPGDIGTDIIAAKSYLRGGTLFPDNIQAELESWFAEEPPPVPLSGVIPRLVEYQRGQLSATAKLYVSQAHPPLMPLILVPLVKFFGSHGAFLVHSAISLAALALCLLLVIKGFRINVSTRILAGLFCIVFAWQPVLATLRQGQFTLWIAALVMLSWFFLRHEIFWASGVALGLAISLKVYPAILLLYLAFRHRRAFWSAVLTCAGTALAISATAGFGSILQFMQASRAISSEYGAAFNNFSLLARLPELPGDGHSQVLNAGKFVVAGIVSCLALYAVAHGRPRQKDGPLNTVQRFDAELALFVCLSCLLSPICWSHYFVLLLLPLAVTLFTCTSSNSRASAVGWGLIALGLSLPDQPAWWLAQRLSLVFGARFGQFLAAFPTFAMLALTCWLWKLCFAEKMNPVDARLVN